MNIDILTLFPNFFESPLNESIIKKAINKKYLKINKINIRDFSKNKHKKVDDHPYSGGNGMLLKAEPIISAYESINKLKKNKTIYLSPQGKLLNHNKIIELSKYDQLILLCGHYEGVDQRVIDLIIEEEISIGNYILTGGEIPALVLIDSIARTLKGVLGNKESFKNDSLTNGLLKYPQYTMPKKFKGIDVPSILISGDHKKIKEWKHKKSIETTKFKRPDLFEKYIKKGEKNE